MTSTGSYRPAARRPATGGKIVPMPYSRSENEFVSAVMSSKLLTAAAGDALTDAARRMAERRVGAILVTDGSRLEGIMTERDVLRAVGAGQHRGHRRRLDDAPSRHRHRRRRPSARPPR